MRDGEEGLKRSKMKMKLMTDDRKLKNGMEKICNIS